MSAELIDEIGNVTIADKIDYHNLRDGASFGMFDGSYFDRNDKQSWSSAYLRLGRTRTVAKGKLAGQRATAPDQLRLLAAVPFKHALRNTFMKMSMQKMLYVSAPINFNPQGGKYHRLSFLLDCVEPTVPSLITRLCISIYSFEYANLRGLAPFMQLFADPKYLYRGKDMPPDTSTCCMEDNELDSLETGFVQRGANQSNRTAALN
ncbi:hypothetical protein CKM354_001257800 [Cercospora kikuchii]|uniref:Uncharacterized protein n=1 Tax=Cercospora kikuchii TaxID=84275 RepID=A0A9P3FM91_9PEZI|nr:uncharacterized protein CKM354_001257800 [Cercospora kikuchii]GIZ49548.1 hypothetical protein CKM354_001257800 [Cercospora kikuchii]